MRNAVFIILGGALISFAYSSIIPFIISIIAAIGYLNHVEKKPPKERPAQPVNKDSELFILKEKMRSLEKRLDDMEKGKIKIELSEIQHRLDNLERKVFPDLVREEIKPLEQVIKTTTEKELIEPTEQLEQLKQLEEVIKQTEPIKPAEEIKRVEQIEQVKPVEEAKKVEPVMEKREEQKKEEIKQDQLETQRPASFTIRQEKKPNEWWEKFQEQFIENWTGILGSVILVLGLGFLGVYTALKLAPVFRFIGLVLVSGILLGLFFYLKRNLRFLKLALWLRSTAGALFLFACLGSLAFPGIQWIDETNKILGLSLFYLGIGINLLLAFIEGQQIFASLHVLLSLAALSVTVSEPISFFTAVVVTLFGVALTYREKWEYHLLLTITLFFGYHLLWYSQPNYKEIIGHNLIGILSIVAVSVLAMLVHYRDLYKTDRFERMPFLVHFFNWLYFGIGLALHSTGSKAKTFILLGGSIAAFFLARRARRMNIRWLYITDTLVAQIVIIIAIFSLNRWNVALHQVLAIVLLESMAFIVITIEEKEHLLTQMGILFKYFSAAYLLYVTLDSINITLNMDHLKYELVTTLSVCLVACTAFHIYLTNKTIKIISSGSKTAEYGWLPYLSYFAFFFNAFIVFYFFIIKWEWKPVAISAIALLSFLCAALSKVWNSKKLYTTWMITGQVFAQLAFLSLHILHIQQDIILTFMFAETCLFLLWIMRDEEALLRQLATINLWVVSYSLVVRVLSDLSHAESLEIKIIAGKSGLVVLCMAFALAYFIYWALKTKDLAKWHDYSFGILISLLFVSAFGVTYPLQNNEQLAAAAIMALIGIGLLFLRRLLHSNGLGTGLIIAVPLTYFMYLFNAFSKPENSLAFDLAYIIPFLALSFAGIRWLYLDAHIRKVKAFAISLFYIQLAIGSNDSLREVSILLPGIAWLVFAVITIEIVCWLRNHRAEQLPEKGFPDYYMRKMAYLLIGAFLLRHLFVLIDSHAMIGLIRVRLLSELAGLAALIYFALRKIPEHETSWRKHQSLHYLFLEWSIMFAVFTVALELDMKWFPIIWIVSALILLLRGSRLTGETSRIRLYSLFFYWASTVYVALIPGKIWATGGTPSMYWYDKPWIIDCTAILLQFIFIVLIRKLPFLGNDLRFPASISALKNMAEEINLKMNQWIYYPLFISVALFLYQTFDKHYLTLLWVVECLIIFITGLILKEKHFIYVANSGLVLSVIRLVFFDLAQTDLIARALVLIGVGVIILFVNYLGTKFRERF